MNPEQFDRILRQVMVLPVVALLLAAGALFWAMQRTNHTVRSIQRADECIAQATLVLKLIVDEESGLRGFQATGDPSFLDSFQDSKVPLDRGFDALQRLLNGEPKDLADKDLRDLDALRDDHAAWADGFARPLIATLRGGGETSDLTLNLMGKMRMDAIRADVDAMIQDSEARRAAEIARWHRQVQGILIGLLTLAGVMGLLIGLFTRDRMKLVSSEYGESQAVLRRRADELFTSEQHLRTTLASIGDGVITCDMGGLVATMNEVAEALTGWTEAEASGRPIGEVFRVVNQQTRQAVEDPATMVKRLNRTVGHMSDTMLLRKDGSELMIDDNGAPIRGKDGTLTGIVMVFRDVTNERKTQAALLANEKLAVAGRLAATISHEIHNPLDSVGNLLFLMQSESTPEETRQFLALAQQELSRVTQISRAMLGLYRESHAPVPVDLRETIADLLLLMERRFQTLGVTVTEAIQPGVQVDGFPAELRQVFTNLITNAAEAAAGRKDGTVRLSAEPVAMGVVVTIADNGGGIPLRLRDHLFQPFFTTKGEVGTGLGLWVCQGIIRKHGGSIAVESRHAEDEPEGPYGTSIRVFLAKKPTIHPGAD